MLADGTGHLNPSLQPLLTMLATVPNPYAALRTLCRDRPTTRLLAELAAGRIQLSHEGLDAHGPPRATAYLRSMLVAAGVLPVAEQSLLDFERFLGQRLATLAEHPHQRLLQQFGLWHQLPRMRAKAATRPLTFGAYVYAQQQFLAGESFLTWLARTERQPRELTQPDLDTWMVNARRGEQERVRGFLTWAMTSRRLPTLTVFVVPPRQREPITQRQRLDLLYRLATDDTIRLSTRVVALLVLLYAQPLSRIRMLTLDDITVDNTGEVHIGLGKPPSPVPEPFAGLLLQLTRHRDNGRNAGQPMGYVSLRRNINSIGIQPRSTRVAALRQLVLQVPATVVAASLGFHYTTADRQARNVGGVWNRYAAIPEPRTGA